MFHDCYGLWEDFKNISSSCEQEEITDCGCWENVLQMKKNFSLQCLKTSEFNLNTTGKLQ